MKPNKENITKWVEALESGEYKQTKEMLRNEEGYCCLGVACDIYAKEHNNKTAWSKHDGSGPKAPYAFRDNRGVTDGYSLTIDVLKWLFTEYDPLSVDVFVHVEEGRKRSVITLNDEWDYDFNKIAKALREEYLRDENDNG